MVNNVLSAMQGFLKFTISGWVIFFATFILHITLLTDRNHIETTRIFYVQIFGTTENFLFINDLMSNMAAVLFLIFGFNLFAKLGALNYVKRVESFSEFRIRAFEYISMRRIKDIFLISLSLNYLFAVIAHYNTDFRFFEALFSGFGVAANIISVISMIFISLWFAGIKWYNNIII